MSTRSKRHNPYKDANEAFLEVKAKEEGIHVLEEGHGTRCPKPGGIVYVHYTGRLIDGMVFDTTEA